MGREAPKYLIDSMRERKEQLEREGMFEGFPDDAEGLAVKVATYFSHGLHAIPYRFAHPSGRYPGVDRGIFRSAITGGRIRDKRQSPLEHLRLTLHDGGREVPASYVGAIIGSRAKRYFYNTSDVIDAEARDMGWLKRAVQEQSKDKNRFTGPDGIVLDVFKPHRGNITIIAKNIPSASLGGFAATIEAAVDRGDVFSYDSGSPPWLHRKQYVLVDNNGYVRPDPPRTSRTTELLVALTHADVFVLRIAELAARRAYGVRTFNTPIPVVDVGWRRVLKRIREETIVHRPDLRNGDYRRPNKAETNALLHCLMAFEQSHKSQESMLPAWGGRRASGLRQG